MVSASLNLIPIEKSCYHGSKSSGSQQTVAYKYGSETEKNWQMTFKCMAAFRNKTVAQSFLPSFNNKNGCLRQESLLRFDPEI